MQTNQQKQTKTYGLVGFDAPFRQGRSLSLPTLPFQRTNRYAVDGAKQVTNRHIEIKPLTGISSQKNSNNDLVFSF